MRERCPQWSARGNDSAGDSGPRIACGIRPVVVGSRMHHDSRSVGIEHARGSAKGAGARLHVHGGGTVRADNDVLQVARVRTQCIVKTMLMRRRVPVTTCRRKRRHALPDGVQVNAVRAWRESAQYSVGGQTAIRLRHGECAQLATRDVVHDRDRAGTASIATRHRSKLTARGCTEKNRQTRQDVTHWTPGSSWPHRQGMTGARIPNISS